jgi:hypothetical protein
MLPPLRKAHAGFPTERLRLSVAVSIIMATLWAIAFIHDSSSVTVFIFAAAAPTARSMLSLGMFSARAYRPPGAGGNSIRGRRRAGSHGSHGRAG